MKILEKLPDCVIEINIGCGPREASGIFEGNFVTYHYCPHCKGWIRGIAKETYVNSIEPSRLSGKRGLSFCCANCGKEIYFSGSVS